MEIGAISLIQGKKMILGKQLYEFLEISRSMRWALRHGICLRKGLNTPMRFFHQNGRWYARGGCLESNQPASLSLHADG